MSINIRGLPWYQIPLLLKSESCYADTGVCDTLEFNTIRRIGGNITEEHS